MARSHAIWIVTGEASRKPVAAFTVKHELVKWLQRRNGHSMLRLWYAIDNGDQTPVQIDMQYLMANPTKPGKAIS